MGMSDVFAMNIGVDGIALKIFLAIAFLLVGIFVGKFVAYLINKIAKGLDIDKQILPSFIGLITVVIKWSIYLVFFNLALKQLPFLFLGDFFGEILLIIPAFTGALILIGIGFVIAIYLREVIVDSEIREWKTLSEYIYYFILYVFGVYSVNLALIAVDSFIRGILIVTLTVVVGGAVAYDIVKKK